MTVKRHTVKSPKVKKTYTELVKSPTNYIKPYAFCCLFQLYCCFVKYAVSIYKGGDKISFKGFIVDPWSLNILILCSGRNIWFMFSHEPITWKYLIIRCVFFTLDNSILHYIFHSFQTIFL